MQGRKILCEAEAVHRALGVQRGDLGEIKAALLALLRRNPDVLSAAARAADGRLLVEVGDHQARWDASGVEDAAGSHMRAVLLGAAHLGRWRCGFHGPVRSGILSPSRIHFLLLTGFVTSIGFAGTVVYLKRASATPTPIAPASSPIASGRTLNTVIEGVLVLDRDQRIALANDAFAETVRGARRRAHRRRALGQLPWQRPAWRARDRRPSPGCVRSARGSHGGSAILLSLRTGAAGLRKVSVNSTPDPRRRRHLPGQPGHLRRPDPGREQERPARASCCAG